LWIDSCQEQETSKLDLGTTQFPIQCVLGTLSEGVKWPGSKNDISLQTSVDTKKERS